MTGANFLSLVRKYTGTNTATFPTSDVVLFANIAKDELAPLISEKNTLIFAVPATRDLIADQREYPFPTDVLNKMLRLELKFTSTGSFVVAQALKNYRGSSTESEIVKYYTNERPFYTVFRNSIYILSGTIPSLTNALRFFYEQYPSDIDSSDLSESTDLSIPDGDTEAAMPRSMHEIWARRVSILYKASQPGRKLPLNPLEQQYEVDLQKVLDALEPVNLDEETIGDIPEVPEYDYGYNL